LLERQFRREFLGDRRKLSRAFPAVSIGCERFKKPLGSDRANEEVAGAGAHRVDRHRNAVAVAKHDDRQPFALFAELRDDLGARFIVPSAEQDRLNFTAMRALQEGIGHLAVGRTDGAPAGARRDSGNQPALVGVGIEQQ